MVNGRIYVSLGFNKNGSVKVNFVGGVMEFVF